MPTNNNNNNNKRARPSQLSTSGSRASTAKPKTNAPSAQGTDARRSASASGNRSTSTPASRQKRARSKEPAAKKAEGVASSSEEDSSEDDSESVSDSSSSTSSSSSSLAEGKQPSGKYKTRKPTTVEEKREMVAEVAALCKTAEGALDIQSLKQHFEWFCARSVMGSGATLKGFIVHDAGNTYSPLPSPDVLQEIEEEMHQRTHPHPTQEGVKVVLTKDFWALFHERGYFGGQNNIHSMFKKTYAETWWNEQVGGGHNTPHSLPTPDLQPTCWMTADPLEPAHVSIEPSSSSSSDASPLDTTPATVAADRSHSPAQSRPQPGAAASTEYVTTTTHVISVRGHEDFVCVSRLNKEDADVISSLRHELLTKEHELKETDAHYAQEVKRLESELSKLRAQGSQVPGAHIQEFLPAQDADLDTAHTSAVELQKQLDAVQGELDSKKEELTETKTHHEQVIANFRKELQVAHNSVVDLQKHLASKTEELTQTMTHHAQEIAQLKSDFGKERTQVQDFITTQCVELDAAQKSVVELKQQLEAAQGKLVAEEQYSSQQLNDLRDTHAKETATSELNTETMQKELMDAQLQLASTEGKKNALVEQVNEKSAAYDELMRSIHQDKQNFQEERHTLEEKATAAQKSVVDLAAAAAQEIALLRTQKDQVQAQKDQLDAAFFVDREGIMNANNVAFAQMAARHQAELGAASAVSNQVVQAWRQFVLGLHPADLEQAQRNLLNVQ